MNLKIYEAILLRSTRFHSFLLLALCAPRPLFWQERDVLARWKTSQVLNVREISPYPDDLSCKNGYSLHPGCDMQSKGGSPPKTIWEIEGWVKSDSAHQMYRRRCGRNGRHYGVTLDSVNLQPPCSRANAKHQTLLYRSTTHTVNSQKEAMETWQTCTWISKHRWNRYVSSWMSCLKVSWTWNDS